ncbi:MAG: heat-inducible transcriptional repressor HrcA [Bacilli bacterium]
MFNRSDYILKLIIEHFVQTAQPVGSKTLIENYDLQLSSATIRNEMQLLENEGFLEKTHTSSGRVPSSKGYKYYIENLRDKKKNNQIKFELQTILNERTQTIEDMLKESCEILSEMTNLVSLVLGNNTSEETLASLQMIPIGNNSSTVIFVTNRGAVESKTFFFDKNIKVDDLEKCISMLNKRLVGTSVSELVPKMKLLEPIIHDYIIDGDVIYQTILKTLGTLANDKVVMYGKDKLLDQPEFSKDPERIKDVIDLFESPTFFKEITEKVQFIDKDITVKIGGVDERDDISIVSAKIYIPGVGENVISLIGPKRMNYDKAYEAIETLVDELNKKFEEISKGDS